MSDLGTALGYGSSSAPATLGGAISQMASQGQAAEKEIGQTEAKVEGARQQYADTMKGVAEQANGLTPPTLTLPPEPKMQQTDPLKTFGSTAMWLAIAGGMLTRRPLLNSLNAATGVLNAVKANDKAAFDQAFQSWKVNIDNSEKLYNFQKDAYQAALQKLSTDAAAAKADLDATASALDDPAMKLALKRADWGSAVPDLIMRREEMQARLMEVGQKADEFKMKFGIFNALQTARSNLAAAQQSGDPRKIAAAKDEVSHAVQMATDYAASSNPAAAASIAKTEVGVDGATGLLTGDDLDYAAEKYRRSGTMPPQGMGSTGPAAANRQNIIKQAQQLAQLDRTGGTMPQGAINADFDQGLIGQTKADEMSMRNLQKMDDAAVSFEATARRNFDLALSLAPKGVPTNLGPWINSWIQTGETGSGNPDVPAYVAALLTGADEYAKIMSGSTGAVGSTDSSRAQAAQLFSPALNTDQISSVIKVAEKDMANRKSSLKDQIDTIRGRLNTRGKEPDSSGSAARPMTQADYDALSSGSLFIDPDDGKTYRKP